MLGKILKCTASHCNGRRKRIKFTRKEIIMEQILHARARTTNSIYKDATVNKYHYESKAQLQIHLQTFIDAYNHVKQLKALKRLTPWELNPLMFGFDPAYYNMGPHKR